MVENSGHRVFRMILSNTFDGFKFDEQLFTDITSNIVDILTKKLPADVNFNPTKLDSVIHKIKLVPI